MRGAPCALLGMVSLGSIGDIIIQWGGIGSYLTKFFNFSSVVKTATRAAARCEGDNLVLHTLLVDKAPLVQSGKGAKNGS